MRISYFYNSSYPASSIIFFASKPDILSIATGTELRRMVKNNIKLNKVCTHSIIFPNIS